MSSLHCRQSQAPRQQKVAPECTCAATSPSRGPPFIPSESTLPVLDFPKPCFCREAAGSGGQAGLEWPGSGRQRGMCAHLDSYCLLPRRSPALAHCREHWSAPPKEGVASGMSDQTPWAPLGGVL